MLRPHPTRWFEIIAARSDAFLTLEALAAAGCVEVEWHETDRLPGASGTPAELLRQFEDLARRYKAYWPAPATRLAPERRAPSDALAAAIADIHAWALSADPLIGQQQAVESRVTELTLTAHALRELADSSIDFEALAHARHGVVAALLALPIDAQIELPVNVLARVVSLPKERLVVAVGEPALVEAAARMVVEAGGRRAHFPDWLQPTAHANIALVSAKLAEEQAALQPLKDRLDQLAQHHRLAQALATVARAGWCFEHGGAIDSGDVFARITGWTIDPQRVVDALERCDARAVVAFPVPPRGARPPLVLRNPWWAQPFEVFTRLVGMPGSGGADPSALLAFAVPLMFGYMFGDVGQGAVLLAVGLTLRKKLPVLALLVPGGLSAILFGFVFGSVFGNEHLIPALWVHPIEEPIPVLAASLIFGFLVVTLGLALDAHQCHWRGDDMEFWGARLGLPMTYFGILFAIVFTIVPAGRWPIQPAWGIWYAMLGTVWFIVGYGLRGRPEALPAAGNAAGEYIETVLQLLVNTISFVRVGAFALAHGGLSAAIVGMADGMQSMAAKAAVMTLGNALIIGLEGLVVSIQTTRLVLFEFFIRFLRSSARSFKPLPSPDDEAPGKQRRES
jgi:V/A-type H+-transporting ATPase subunit I